MNLFNLHTHTLYCDGSANPEDYIKYAILKGFKTLGFSGHAPVPFENSYAIKIDELQNYCNDIVALKKKYINQINILLALEIDFIPGLTDDFNNFIKKCNLDYTIGSIHLVTNKQIKKLWFIDGANIEDYDLGLIDIFNGDIRLGVTAFFHQTNEMLLSQKPDILGHFDKIKMNNKSRYFSSNEKWYKVLIDESIEIIKKQETIVEVNTRGLYKKRSDELFPGFDILKKLHQQNIPITLSTDAHKPEEIDFLMKETRILLKEIGFRTLMNFSGNFWYEEEI